MRDSDSLPEADFDTRLKARPPTSTLSLSDDKKADILTQYWMSLRANIHYWQDMAYKATVWSMGIVLSATGYCILKTEGLSILQRLLLGSAFIVFGALTQAFLNFARRAHIATGRAIDRVQASLRLCDEGEYIKSDRFFGFSGQYLLPRSIIILQCVHAFAIIFSVLVIWLVPGKSS